MGMKLAIPTESRSGGSRGSLKKRKPLNTYQQGWVTDAVTIPAFMQQQWATLSSSRNRQAFSLIELVIVMAIIGLLSAMAVPRFANASMRSRIDSAAKRVAADLELARKYAIHSSTPQTVTFSGNSYEIPGLRHLSHSTSSYNVDLADEPYRAQIKNAMFGGDSEISFDIYGSADSGGTVDITVAKMHRRVRINATTGQITIRIIAE